VVAAQERFHPDVIERIRHEIAESDGQEVLFVGHIDGEGLVESVEAYARGNISSVAVPVEFCDPGDVIIHNHPSGTLRPSDRDVAVSASLSESGIGSMIVDNDVTSVYVLVEPVPPETIVLLDEEELAGTIDEGGVVAATLPEFRVRPSQVEMLRNFVRGFNDDRIAVAEAGTGIGKSFAYLIPAVAWAAANRERVVIATATINLQQQLIDRDLRTVQRALGTNVATALVKGRGNYLCRRRFDEFREEESLFQDTDETEALGEWAETTPTGSRSDLPFFVADEVWNRINSETDTCSVARCPDRERCFILKARRAAAGAQILVANHHLVFSDLAIRRAGAGWEQTAVLPPFQRLVFDEAHNLERSATSFFSESVSRFSIQRQIGRILRRRGARRFGLLENVPGLEASPADITAVENEVERVREQLGRFNDSLVAFMADEYTWRLTPETDGPFHRDLAEVFVETYRGLLTLAARLNTLIRGIDDTYREESAFLQLVAVTRRIGEIAGHIDRFTRGIDETDQVFWMERRTDPGGNGWVRIVITPLELSELMQEAVYEPYGTVIMTSATLTVNGTFDFWGGRIGLPLLSERVVTGRFESPFDYRERVQLAVPQDAPFPDDGRYEAYLQTLVQRLVHAAGGGALVLFTSYRQLSSVFGAVAPELERRGYSCYRQGEDDRARLLERFVEDTAGVLFATDSFWEGVDAPGETLRLVVVCRLPFRVPTDPVQLARAEAIERGGGNSFYDFSLPQAVMRLKQGFGRLMRRHDDYGVVVVTDPRMIRKPYGRVFWDSLPPASPLILHGEGLVEEVSTWIARGRNR